MCELSRATDNILVRKLVCSTEQHTTLPRESWERRGEKNPWNRARRSKTPLNTNNIIICVIWVMNRTVQWNFNFVKWYNCFPFLHIASFNSRIYEAGWLAKTTHVWDRIFVEFDYGKNQLFITIPIITVYCHWMPILIIWCTKKIFQKYDFEQQHFQLLIGVYQDLVYKLKKIYIFLKRNEKVPLKSSS